MKILVLPERCVGHARCQDRCPEVFGTDAELGKVQVLMPDVPPHLRDNARRAARSCPERAIQVTEDEA